MLFSRRLDTQDCDHKLIKKLLTKFINQARISHKLTCNCFFFYLDIAVQMLHGLHFSNLEAPSKYFPANKSDHAVKNWLR